MKRRQCEKHGLILQEDSTADWGYIKEYQYNETLHAVNRSQQSRETLLRRLFFVRF